MHDEHAADVALALCDPATAVSTIRRLFVQHPQGVFSLDLDGRFTSVNPAAQALSGYTEAELLGRPFAELLPPEEVPGLVEVFAHLLDRTPQRLTVRFLGKAGSVSELDVVGVPIVVGDDLVGVYGITENITGRRRLERQVEEARRAAEVASEAKSVFLANMSHEIRTPLASVLAAAELLAESELDPGQRRLVATMDRAGERLLRLVSQILDFSRIEAGHADVVRVPVSLRTLLESLVVTVGHRLHEKDVRLDLDVDPAVPEALVGDPMLVAQVLDNLVGNAVKFTPSGLVSLRAELTPTPEASVWIRFTVTDTGIGLTPEQQETIFDSFSQADPSITRVYGGTGLGLAIVRGLVRQLGGSVAVDSALGAGSVFTVDLPFDRPDQREH